MKALFLSVLGICGMVLVIALTVTAIFAIIRYALLPLGAEILSLLGLL